MSYVRIGSWMLSWCIGLIHLSHTAGHTMYPTSLAFAEWLRQSVLTMASYCTGDRLRLQLAGFSESARSRLQYNTKLTPPVS